MFPALTISVFALWHTGWSQTVLITQWPGYISSQPDASVKMHCYQNNTDHPYMFWYRQQRGKEPVLMATLVAGSPSYEPGFDSVFGVSSSEKKMWSLAVEAVRITDEAVYLCAASQHGAAECCEDSNLLVMLWYQHRPVSRDMTLIGYGYATSDPSYEGQFQESFQLTREDILRGALLLPRAAPADSAVYFCAASTQWLDATASPKPCTPTKHQPSDPNTARPCITTLMSLIHHLTAPDTRAIRHHRARASLQATPTIGHVTCQLVYRELTASQMRMLASSMGKNVSSVEAGSRYAMSRPNLTYSSLEIRQLEGQDSAVYLCASTTGTLIQSSHMARQQPRNHTVEWGGEGGGGGRKDGGYPAYFGGGTKLTVLDPDISDKAIQPNVTVLPPSIHECKDAKDNKNKKTLVCVATGFYPDHVSVSWKLGDRIVTDGVGTDNSAVWNNKTKYSITSRLRVPAGEWYTDSNKFTCTVLFFDGTEYIPFESSVMGDKAQSTGGMTTENYVKSTQTAKLAYIVFIAKSSLYGFFVVVFVWKLQGKSGKHFT
ncbi:uncharacterized protein LOC134026630 [Osmerus eperlanus]|uniref:uncharacterized protein LOC134026630 n=1 Tax=Osmerus eperlanus TaxID=29151 RepID=UPI002E0EE798